MNDSATLLHTSAEIICSSPNSDLRVSEARDYEAEYQARLPSGSIMPEGKRSMQTAYKLECLAYRQFWLSRGDLPRVAAQASDLAKALLHTIELTRVPNGAELLIEGMAEGAMQTVQLRLATAEAVILTYRRKFMEGIEWADTPEEDATAIREFGVAVGQISPGHDLGAGEGSHLMVATIAFIRALSSTEQSDIE